MNKEPDTSLDRVFDGVSPEEAARLRAVWDLLGDTEPMADPDPAAVEHALAQVQARLAPPSQAVPSRSTRPDRPAHPVQRAAPVHLRWRSRPARAVLAVTVVLLVAGGYWWQQPLVETAPPGERRLLTLSDGSRVELNSGAALRYRRRFGAVRAVRLEGEAFFDVAPAVRPFVVETFNARIEVLGTRFGVRAWPGEPEATTTVALVSGRVQLAPLAHPEQAVTLTPGEARQVTARDAPTPAPVAANLTVAEATAWRTGDLVFKDQPLGVILDDVERRFAVQVAVQPAALARQRLNLALRQPAAADAVLRDLATALGLRYRETANGYELYGE